MLLTLVCPCLAALLAVSGAAPPPPSHACEARMDAWCNVKTNNPSCTQSCGKGEKMYALRQNGSQAFQPQPGPAWRCYAASTLDKTHTIYDGTSRCYSSEQVQLEWQLCACNAGCPSSATVCAKCGAMPKPRGFHPSPPPPSPPSPPAPPGPTVVNIPLFQPGEANRTGVRIPALLAVGRVPSMPSLSPGPGPATGASRATLSGATPEQRLSSRRRQMAVQSGAT
jgi:hypothetical protein